MKIKNCFSLFLSFLKIGLFTFGGGYAMIPLIQSEVIDKKKWLNKRDILDILAIAESTPGPIAVNSATYVGYKVAGVLGSIFATIGLIIPSFVIILLISFVLDKLMAFSIVQSAFKGIKVGVVLLLIVAVNNLAKSVNRNKYFFIAFTIALIISIIFSIFLSNFSYISIILILLGLLYGIFYTVYQNKRSKK